jgi:hypothetical protein
MPTGDALLKAGKAHIRTAQGTLAGYRQLEIEEHPKLTVGIWGGPKTYKTPLAYSFPEPVYHINLDREAETLAPWNKGRNIQVCDILVPPDEELTADLVNGILHEFMDAYRGALLEKQGTVVVDTVSVLWTLIQVFVLKGTLERKKLKGGKDELFQFDYADANMLYENILLATKASKIHSVFIARGTDDYNSAGNRTGKLKPQMQKNTPYMVNLWLHMTREELMVAGPERTLKNGKVLPSKLVPQETFVATVEGSGFHKDQEGLKLPEPEFAMLEQLAKHEIPERGFREEE